LVVDDEPDVCFVLDKVLGENVKEKLLSGWHPGWNPGGNVKT